MLNCRIFTPAQPTNSAASLRDFCSGAYTRECRKLAAVDNSENSTSRLTLKELPSRATLARRWPEVEPAQVRRVAQRIHACGQRAAFEFIADLARGRDFAETLADFGRLDPVLYAAVVALACDGGHA
ncbi:hypothetical protein [Methylocystis sp.]|uniref:hypothetical protein n=1 Tax=Methylocystis sp. TaxID=1911079 RepID=UPI0025FA08A5|nr:hypothetical protein [Methylocystis sp.]